MGRNHEKHEETRRRFLGEDHPETAQSYSNVAINLDAQGDYAQAQPLHEKAVAINRRVLSRGHPQSAECDNNLAGNLAAQGEYAEARDRSLGAVEGQDAARLRVAFAGLERGMAGKSAHPALAAVQARLGRPAQAWQALEEDLGRGLLDELAARRDERLTPAERDRLHQLMTELEGLDRLMEAAPKDLGQAEARGGSRTWTIGAS